MRGNSQGGCSRMRKRMSEVRRERDGFLCGLDRDELECSNVRETTSPHLPFPRTCAHAGKEGCSRGIGRVRGGAAGKRGVGDKGSRARRRT